MGLLAKLFGRRSEPRGRVVFDGERVTMLVRDGDTQTVQWADLIEVGILTTDEGPAADDVMWMLLGTDGQGCAIPSDLEGMEQLLHRLQQLPGFNNDAVIEAMGSTSNAKFVC